MTDHKTPQEKMATLSAGLTSSVSDALHEARPAMNRLADRVNDGLSDLAAKGISGQWEDVPGQMPDGAVIIAAITSCTNTSNPRNVIAAGLLARNANRLGLSRKPWVKSSLAPGSKTVALYLKEAGLDEELKRLGFGVVAFPGIVPASLPYDQEVLTNYEAGFKTEPAPGMTLNGSIFHYDYKNYQAFSIVGLPAAMLWGMLLMAMCFWMYSIAVAFMRVRTIMLERERHTAWARQAMEGA